jgi:hypothetical protein
MEESNELSWGVKKLNISQHDSHNYNRSYNVQAQITCTFIALHISQTNHIAHKVPSRYMFFVF